MAPPPWRVVCSRGCLCLSGCLAHAHIQSIEERRDDVRCAQVASKLDKDDLDKIEKEVDEAISWLDANQLAETEELEHKLKELEGVCSPIISKMYAGAGGACHTLSVPHLRLCKASCHMSSACVQELAQHVLWVYSLMWTALLRCRC